MVSLDLSPYSILIVDDIAFAHDLMTRQLMGMGEPTFHHANDGAQALEVLQSAKTVDFVISDINMPVMNGLQLLKAIRTDKAGVSPSMPYAIITSFSDSHLVEMALALDVTVLLVKPVSNDRLSARLEKMLAQTDDEPWLKPAETYQEIVIDEWEDGKLITPASLEDRRATLRAMRREPKTETPSTGKDAIPVAETEIRVALDEVQAGAVVSRDIYTAGGRLYLPAGTKLTRRVISLLQDLKRLGLMHSLFWVQS